MADDRIRVALVFGGRSSEHAVSCSTAASVMSAIDRSRYDVVPVGIGMDGSWVLLPDTPEPLRLLPGQTPTVDSNAPGVVVPTSAERSEFAVVTPGEGMRSLGRVDVVFPLLHGPFGEDGTLQGMLDLAGVRYVGNGVTASAMMMDKPVMKVVLAAAGLPIGPYAVITDLEWRRDPDAALAKVEALGWPVFVKPARAGSSMGITKVRGPQELRTAVEAARQHDPKVIIEAAIVGREIECGVLAGHGVDPPRVSELGEATVLRGHDFYDFDAKYLDLDGVRLSCPAEVPAPVRRTIQELSVRAFEAAGCEGLARCDFFYTEDGAVYLNEVNTMPGFTPTSMYPIMWDRAGVPYAALIDELIGLAMERRLGLR